MVHGIRAIFCVLLLWAAHQTQAQSISARLDHLIEFKGLPEDRVPVITAIGVQPTGNLLATAGDDHLVRLWNISTGQLVRELEGHRDWVTAVSFGNDGRELITGSRDRRVLIWDSNDGQLLGRLDTHEHPISAIVVASDQTIVAVVGFRAALQLYDLNSRELVRSLACPCQDTRAVAFSPDGQLIAAGGRNGKIRVWNLSTGAKFDIAAHDRRIRAIAFTPDGRGFVSAGDDPVIRVWSPASKKMLQELPSNSGKVLSITMIGNQRLATSSSDNVIRILDLGGTEPPALLMGHTGSIAALAARGQQLISGSFDTTVRIWSIDETRAPPASPSDAPEVFSTANAN